MFWQKANFPIDFNNIIWKTNCSLLNFILNALFLFRMLYIYIYIYIDAGYFIFSRMLDTLFLFRMLYYASKFSILGSHIDQCPLHILIFYLSLKDALFYKASFHYPCLWSLLKRTTMKMLMSWWLGKALIARMAIISLQVNVKIKLTISFTFKLLQCNNSISIQILNKFRNWLGGRQEKFVVGTLPPAPFSGYGPVAHD